MNTSIDCDRYGPKSDKVLKGTSKALVGERYPLITSAMTITSSKVAKVLSQGKILP